MGALPDFDGQRTDDILWSHATPGTFAMWLMNGGVLGDPVRVHRRHGLERRRVW